MKKLDHKTIYKKVDGKTTVTCEYGVTNDVPYLTNEEKCFGGILNDYTVKREAVGAAQKGIYRMINCLNKYFNLSLSIMGRNTIKNLYDSLKEVKTREDLQRVYKMLLGKYKGISSEKEFKYYVDTKGFKEVLEKNEDLVYSIMIKKIISTHFNNIITDYHMYTILKDKLECDEDPKILFSYMEEKYDKSAIKNNLDKLSEKIFLSELRNEFTKSNSKEYQYTKCANCQNAYVSKCIKIREKIRSIVAYDFITDGLQVFDEVGNEEKFIVSKCKNYEKEKPKSKVMINKKEH